MPKLTEKIRVDITVVTPDLASQWLEKNSNNRPVSDAHVAALVKEMKEGRWHLHGQCIQFGEDDTLQDGQHRLWAVVESKQTVKMLVAWGFPKDSMLGIDLGKRRTSADLHRIQTGDIHSKPKVEISNAIYSLLNPGVHRHPSYGEVTSIIETYQEALEWVIGAVPSRVRVGSVACKAALAFAYKTNPVKVGAFAEALNSGLNLTEGDPAYVLREALINSPAATGTAGRRQVAVKALRAIVAAVYDQKIQRNLYATEDAVAYFGLAHGLKLQGSSTSLSSFIKSASGGTGSILVPVSQSA